MGFIITHGARIVYPSGCERWATFQLSSAATPRYTEGMTNPYLTALRCMRCGRAYAPGEVEYTCSCRPNLGSDVGTLDVEWDYEALRRDGDPQALVADRDFSIGRYAALLPIEGRASLPPLPVGWTPLRAAPRLAAQVELESVLLKDDGRNPSASLKDRASAIAVARARESHWPVVATASTGNAAAALASQAAAAGQSTVIFVPRTAPQAKIAQLLVFGATVLAVDGSYDDAFDLCGEACAAFHWYNRSTGYNPYMTEGKKTVSCEIAEQMARLQSGKAQSAARAPAFVAPDAVFVSVGDGCIVGGVHKGFHDLLSLGWVTKMPRIYGVQSTRSAALANAWRDGLEVPLPVSATTRADSISVDAPRDPLKALRAVRASGGAFVTVEDDAILRAMSPLARLGGVFAEPAGAAAWAGVEKAAADGLVARSERIVVINTGSGLKDVAAAMEVTGGVTVIEPTLHAVRQALRL